MFSNKLQKKIVTGLSFSAIPKKKNVTTSEKVKRGEKTSLLPIGQSLFFRGILHLSKEKKKKKKKTQKSSSLHFSFLQKKKHARISTKAIPRTSG